MQWSAVFQLDVTDRDTTTMYDYRKMTPQQQEEVLALRRRLGFPLHAPPHLRSVPGEYLISTACYGHRPIFRESEELSWLSQEVLDDLRAAEIPVYASVFLPNHYHLLAATRDLTIAGERLRKLHSRIAKDINRKQGQKGRRVWYRFSDRLIRSDAHHWATVNYIHFNPVKHGYTKEMESWAWSSAHVYRDEMRAERLDAIWKKYPIGDYGRGWDW